jgi:2-polyprenyl-3-methyl-5-hydroxy-6-metoxy-1,4-benzoquinol methylase
MKTVSDYHFSNASDGLLHPFFKSCVREFLPSAQFPSIMDIGCGNGSLCRYIKDQGHDVVGIEPAPKGYEIAKATHRDIQFYFMGIEDEPPIGLKLVDGIICTEVVEHLFSPRNLPAFCRKVLRPGGRVVVTTPYHGWLKNTAIAVSGKWDSHHNPLWDYGHIKFWSPMTLRALFEEQGFVFEAFRGYGRIPGMWKTMMLSFKQQN